MRKEVPLDSRVILVFPASMGVGRKREGKRKELVEEIERLPLRRNLNNLSTQPPIEAPHDS